MDRVDFFSFFFFSHLLKLWDLREHARAKATFFSRGSNVPMKLRLGPGQPWGGGNRSDGGGKFGKTTRMLPSLYGIFPSGCGGGGCLQQRGGGTKGRREWLCE